MKIDLGHGAYLEPDDGPRISRFHMRMVRVERIEGTRAGNNVTLECGHRVQTFGDLRHANRVVLCTACRDLEEKKMKEDSKNYVTIEEPGFAVKLGPFAWHIETRGNADVGMLLDGTLVAWLFGGESIEVYRHASFEDMVESAGKIYLEYDDCVLNAVARKLGLKTWKGHDGKEWKIDTRFPDMNYEEHLAYSKFHEKQHALSRKFKGNYGEEYNARMLELYRQRRESA